MGLHQIAAMHNVWTPHQVRGDRKRGHGPCIRCAVTGNGDMSPESSVGLQKFECGVTEKSVIPGEDPGSMPAGKWTKNNRDLTPINAINCIRCGVTGNGDMAPASGAG